MSGKLQVRDGVLNAGDYVYEPNGMLHGETTALEDTEYLFICNGPVLFFASKSSGTELDRRLHVYLSQPHQVVVLIQLVETRLDDPVLDAFWRVHVWPKVRPDDYHH